MAVKLGYPASLAPDISIGLKILNNGTSHRNMEIHSLGFFLPCKKCCSLTRTLNPPAATYKTESGASEGSPEESESTGSSVQSQLDLLKQLTSNNTLNLGGYGQASDSSNRTIREQLCDLVDDEAIETTIPLGKRLKSTRYNSLTISQKRNIRRQEYLNKVAKRNDIPFFITIALFVILPPAIILGVAVATGYVDPFP